MTKVTIEMIKEALEVAVTATRSLEIAEADSSIRGHTYVGLIQNVIIPTSMAYAGLRELIKSS